MKNQKLVAGLSIGVVFGGLAVLSLFISDSETAWATFFLCVWLGTGLFAVFCEHFAERFTLKGLSRAGIGTLVALALAHVAGTVVGFGFTGFVGPCLVGILAVSGFYLGLRWEEGGNFSAPGAPSASTTKGGSAAAKLLDTSVIIDGRIAEVADTGFLEGIFYIPRFVLQELQRIADSSDPLKRNRGRRGLDILNRMQKSKIRVEVLEVDAPETREVDEKLLVIGKQRNAKVITNDFNLNKVAEIRGVPVLNINDLANALKPAVLPGEIQTIRVIKEGKESGQGIGYLDDGTMVVVDNGKVFMGQKIEVVVTSALQTAAGRMIFAKKKDEAGDIVSG